MKLVTVATDTQGYFKWFIESCKRHNYDLTVLGYGEKWLGFAWRFKMVMEFLHKLPSDEIVCFIDAYDVIMIKDARVMEEKFKKLTQETNFKILIAKETYQSLYHQNMGYLLFGQCHGQNLNAGTYIGYVKDIKDALMFAMSINKEDNADDQAILSNVCRIHPSFIRLDERNDIFLTIVRPFLTAKIGVAVFKNEIENNDACVLHAPVNGDISDIIRYLGYDITVEDQQSIQIHVYALNVKKSLMIMKKYLVYACAYISIGAIVILVVMSIYRRGKTKMR